MKYFSLIFISFAGCALLPRASAQTQFVYDGFQYPAGSLIGLNGGQGWSGAWAPTGTGQTAPTVLGANAFTSGAYSDSWMVPQGGTVNKAGGLGAFQRPLADQSAYFAPGDVVWFVLLLNPRAALVSGVNLELGFYAAANPSGLGSGFGFTLTGQGAGSDVSLFADLGGTLSPTSVNMLVGSTTTANHLLVGKLTMGSGGASDVFQIWLDPTATSLANVATLTPDAVATGHLGAVPDTFGVNSVLQVSNAGEPFNMDELSLYSEAVAPTIATPPAAQSATAGSNASFTVTAAGTGPFTYQWYANGTALADGALGDGTVVSGSATATLTLTGVHAADNGASYDAVVTNSAGSVTSSAAVLTVTSTVAAPAITTQPTNQSAVAGGNVTLSVAATGTPTPSYQWYKNGVALSDGSGVSGSATATLTLTDVQTAGNGASYDVVVTNSAGSTTSAKITLTVTAAATATLANVSGLGQVGSGANALIGGFVLSGSTSRTVLIRASGPALAQFGLSGVLANPNLTVYDSAGNTVGSNDDWAASLAADFSRVGAFSFASGSLDAALKLTLAPGAYTAEVGGGTGLALLEIYDDPQTGENAQLVNSSTRALVGPGADMLSGGFSITGSGSRTVLIRAVGPTLGNFGVSQVLADPVITVYGGSGGIVGSNDNWGTASTAPTIVSAVAQVGAFSLADGSLDSALLLTLAPGSYTAEVTGKNGASGVALVEIYPTP